MKLDQVNLLIPQMWGPEKLLDGILWKPNQIIVSFIHCLEDNNDKHTIAQGHS